MITRNSYLEKLRLSVQRSPITALLGPRQCGKTTLARMYGEENKTVYFDLESQPDLRRLQNPELMLGSQKGVVILDEIQELPELFKVLRIVADRPDNQARFIILGSASPDIIKKVSETLAGRVEFVELSGFNMQELGPDALEKLWLRGGFPRSFLAKTDEDSMAWREGFIRTFLDRDIPHFGISIPPVAMRRFWTMIAHYHGQTWNASELGRSMGLSDKTVRSYLDILTGTFMIRQLQPWFENIGKRQVKAPKIYFRDSGLLHGLLNIPVMHSLTGHPRIGASWEGFALEQTLQAIAPAQAFFWAAHSGAEIDLFFFYRGRRYGIEFKFSEAPAITTSIHNAFKFLHLDHVWIIYPGNVCYAVSDRISVWPLKNIAELPEELQGTS